MELFTKHFAQQLLACSMSIAIHACMMGITITEFGNHLYHGDLPMHVFTTVKRRFAFVHLPGVLYITANCSIQPFLSFQREVYIISSAQLPTAACMEFLPLHVLPIAYIYFSIRLYSNPLPTVRHLHVFYSWQMAIFTHTEIYSIVGSIILRTLIPVILLFSQ